MAGKLSIVSTPIGNLEDITLRALRVLREADFVLCEDTRITKRLFSKYDISTHVLSYNEHSPASRSQEILALLEDGKSIALVSDAGTPGISDPGGALVSLVRGHFGDSVLIEAIPGPSALSAALSVAGVPTSSFVFHGFLPHKKGRDTIFREIASSARSHVFYESTHRLVKTLQKLAEMLEPERKVVVVKELTKIHERVIVGPAKVVLRQFLEHPDLVRGEFVVVIGER
ncbi:MAG: 16S rRNA (cytidine(1402)-2'-O)-methyltransferase [Candidatus Vogelbacteria bacterium]|nr:16S rRNA (cytidine(1402)-2'-O)-methyltransferase [Candidatus Vogelbacteria bacterium]